MRAKQLFLAQLSNCTEAEIKKHIVTEYQADTSELKNLAVIIAYEHVGDWVATVALGS